MTQRSERVADQVRQELANLLLFEVKDPRVKLATVARVDLSRDLMHAVVWISVLGEDEDRERAMRGLESASGYLRRQLGSRLRLRGTPELDFRLDRSAEHSQHISDLLEELE